MLNLAYPSTKLLASKIFSFKKKKKKGERERERERERKRLLIFLQCSLLNSPSELSYSYIITATKIELQNSQYIEYETSALY